jgi:hypothetical protein
MEHLREESEAPTGTFSRGWRGRTATVLHVGIVGAIVGVSMGDVMAGLILGAFLGVACVVISEAMLDTEGYRFSYKDS